MICMNQSNNELKVVYFGGEPLGVPVLEELTQAGIVPELIVCNPDRPAGRGKQLTAPPVKVWAETHHIEVWQPESLKDQAAVTNKLQEYDLFVVVAYNKILPEWLIELPKHKTINLHPSLLPKLRGPSPIRSAILENRPNEVGVSIMLMDKEMDHGPLLAQEQVIIPDSNWPISGTVLDQQLARIGGALLAETITAYVAGDVTPSEQQHEKATYTQKLDKAMGELQIDPHNLPTGEAAHEVFCKIQGLAGWPGTYFFFNDERIKITKAQLIEDQLCLETIVPAGRSETLFREWLERQRK